MYKGPLNQLSAYLATASVGDEYIMIQEKLTGKEFGLDVMNDLEGNHVAVSVKQKLAMRAGETDKAITVDLPEVYEIGAKIGRELKHIGNLDVDIMQRANGDYCVLEQIVDKMREKDIYTLLVKGQGIAQCFERPLWRTWLVIGFII